MAKSGSKKAKQNGQEEASEIGIDLRELDRDALLRLRKDVDQALQNYDKRKRDVALREMQEVAEKHGLSMKDFMKNGSARSVNAPKFRHPENPELTWSGRGRQPTWYKEAIGAGADPEDLKI